MLHITNGESTALAADGNSENVLYWRDVLHEGPTPAALSLPEMSQVRARFIADSGWGPFEEVDEGFRTRDSGLARYGEHEEVVLWFEHDLYDQLQLIQVLDWFSVHDRSEIKLSLICIGSFPGMGRFIGLGQLDAGQLRSLFDHRQDVTRRELKLAAEAWMAFCSPDPSDILALLGRNTSALPFLKGAMERHLEQFPSVRNGLSRSERQILEILTSGLNHIDRLFDADQDIEERPFVGDTCFATYIERMERCPQPLVEVHEDESIHITAIGREVLQGNEDAIRLNGIDRWLGGVHLKGEDSNWRWDEGSRKLVNKEASRAHRR